MTAFRMGILDTASMIEIGRALADFEEACADFGEPGPAGVLDFFDIPTADAFDVPPERAIAYFSAKGLRTTFSYADMIGDAHDRAFTVAKMMDVDMLGQVRASLDSALANGTPFREWADGLLPVLQSGGWWGRKAVVDPLTGQTIVAQLGSPWRLETIFRTNMQTAYAAGQWEEIEVQAGVAPFLMYDAVDDHRTRPSHRERDRTVLPAFHSWWRRNTPPLGYNCRCGVIQLDAEQVQALGLRVDQPPPDFDEVRWQNPRTGDVTTSPDGVDPGFGRHPRTGDEDLRRILAEKIAALPDGMRQVAQRAVAQSARQQSVAQAVAAAARDITANAAAGAALAAAQQSARAAEKQVEAQALLDAIAGDRSDEGRFMAAALAELQDDPAWRSKSAKDRLYAVRRRAAAIQRREAGE